MCRSSIDRARAGALERVGAQRVADLAHRRGGLHPAPADVADHDPEAPVGQLERVVPVAARVVARVAGDVADDELVAGQLRQRGRQQRALQRRGGRVLAREQAGVVEREPGAPAELLGELELARRVLAPGLRPDERHRAERAAAGGQRDDHHRVHLQLADELDLLLVERGGLQQRAVDHRVELGAAAADHGGRAGRRVGIGRVALLQLARPADLVGVDVGDRDLLVAAGRRPPRVGRRTSPRARGRRAGRPPRASRRGPSRRPAPGWRRRGTRAPPRAGGAR